MALTTEITLWFYFRSTVPVCTYSISPDDTRLALLLEDVRKVQHGNHVFIHLRSEFELARTKEYLALPIAKTAQTSITAA